MTTWNISRQCMRCQHFLDGHTMRDGKHVCVAFPEEIPEVILAGEFDHSQPYPGDHGIQFEPIDGRDVQPQRVT